MRMSLGESLPLKATQHPKEIKRSYPPRSMRNLHGHAKLGEGPFSPFIRSRLSFTMVQTQPPRRTSSQEKNRAESPVGHWPQTATIYFRKRTGSCFSAFAIAFHGPLKSMQIHKIKSALYMIKADKSRNASKDSVEQLQASIVSS